VQRRERRELADPPDDLVVDHRGLAEDTAAVDDAVPDRVCLDLERLDRRSAPVGVDERELQARRAGVDDEDRA
jgi:hypothetical protein